MERFISTNEEEDQEFSFRTFGKNEWKVEITFKGQPLKFQLKSKRGFVVLIKVLEVYPELLNLHDALDHIYNDPNRAHSDLKFEGFANFLIEKRNKRRAMLLSIDLKKLFKQFGNKNSSEFLYIGPKDQRKSLSAREQSEIFKQFSGRCNITRLKLFDEKELVKEFGKNLFYKPSIVAEYDHRKPLSKSGSNELTNYQLLSKLANKEKNKICNICERELCEECALAWPEKYDTIICNNQSISDIKYREKNNE